MRSVRSRGWSLRRSRRNAGPAHTTGVGRLRRGAAHHRLVRHTAADREVRHTLHRRQEAAYVGITEPTGGADPRNNIRTRAHKEGDVWILNGRKMWISAAATADYGIVFARTRDGAPPQITAFIVEPHFKGIEFKEIEVLRKPSPYEIVLDNCEVPAENVLGEVGGGFGVAQTWLVDARIPYAASCIGMAQEALDMACGWVKSRPARDGVLADKQAIQWMIADSEVELRAARLLTYEAAAKVDAGAPGKVDASVCKLYGTETAWRVVDRAIQMFGGMGVALEMPLDVRCATGSYGSSGSGKDRRRSIAWWSRETSCATPTGAATSGRPRPSLLRGCAGFGLRRAVALATSHN